MVWHTTVAPGDIVVVDRNCHKSILHSIIMTGAVPVFLTPTRNHYGIIGPIPLEEFSMENIRKKIEANPSRARRSQEAAHPHHHPVDLRRRGVQRRGHQGNARRRDRHPALRRSLAAARRLPRLLRRLPRDRRRPSALRESMVFATQSTHKLLAGLSQASQILVQDSQTRKLDRDIFNEAYLMHTSTSPQYAIIASCDVAAAMMEAPAAPRWSRSRSSEAVSSAARCARSDAEFGDDEWWFQVWGRSTSAEEGIGQRDDWMLKAGERWHGFGNLAEGFNMLDPIKATIITPGLNMDGDFAEHTGIPAAIVTKYLPSTASSSRRPACTPSSSCSPSASPRAAGTRW